MFSEDYGRRGSSERYTTCVPLPGSNRVGPVHPPGDHALTTEVVRSPDAGVPDVSTDTAIIESFLLLLSYFLACDCARLAVDGRTESRSSGTVWEINEFFNAVYLIEFVMVLCVVEVPLSMSGFGCGAARYFPIVGSKLASMLQLGTDDRVRGQRDLRPR